jgi:hypothetical protein
MAVRGLLRAVVWVVSTTTPAALLQRARRAGPSLRQYPALRRSLAKPLLWAAGRAAAVVKGGERLVVAVVEEGARWVAAIGRWEDGVRAWADAPGPGTLSAQSQCLLLHGRAPEY